MHSIRHLPRRSSPAHARSPRRQRKGIVLITVVVVIVIIGLMAAASVQTSTIAMKSGVSFRQSMLALYSAEAGMRNVTGNWPTANVNALNAGDSLDLGWTTLPNRASYRVVITRVDNGGLKTWLMVAQGRGTSQIFGQRTIVRMVGNAPLFQWGVFSNSNISLSGNAGSDSYNSANGPYNAATADSMGSIASNGNISASGNTKIKGSASAAGTVTAGSYYTGVVTAHAVPLPTLAAQSCPASYTPAANISGGTYNAATGALSGSGNDVITISGTTAASLSSISLSGNAKLTVNTGGGHVDVYVSGGASISGNGAGNTTGKPTDLNFSACGAGNAAWSFTGNATSTYTVYAPTRAVSVSGNGDLYGAVVASTFSNSGNGQIHYDKSLKTSGGNQLFVLAGSWTELTLY
jgi:hypothetical protein